MPSSLTWLAHSESERRQTQEVMRRLDEPGTLDEIGVGRIRDAIADLLFPGTSTLHTRARYFLFLPWIYRELERRSPLDDPARRARQREVQLIDSLKRQRELDPESLVDGGPIDDSGIIGEVAGHTLSQLPSEAYWNALNIWGLRPIAGSRSAYHRLLGQIDLRRPAVDDDGEPLQGAAGSWWDPRLPAAPAGLMRCATMALSEDEAAYLQERATTRIPDSTLAQLLSLGQPLPWTREVWEQPRDVLNELSSDNRDLIDQADRFSLLVWGAALLYNRMVAEEAQRSDALDQVDKTLEEWRYEIVQRHQELARWRDDIDHFWRDVARANPRVPSAGEQAFVEGWADLALTTEDVRDSVEARDLIADRERRLKRGLARLGNASALEAWNGPSGGARLVFRWPNAEQLISDIHAGLGLIESDGNDA